MIFTFVLTVFAWIFFRAEGVSHAWNYLNEIFSLSLFTLPEFLGIEKAFIITIIIIFFILIEWQGREYQYAIANFGHTWYRPIRWSFYSFLIFVIGMFLKTEESPFIYFQF
jgi:hypothetical protein